MSTPDTTEDFTAASPDAKDGSARWARRASLRLPLRLKLRRGRSLETVPFEPESAPAVDAPAPQLGRHLEPTHRLEGFDLRSVASTALLYYACAFVVLSLGVVLVWVGASVFGVVGHVEDFMRSIGFRDFHVAGFKIIMGAVLVCVAVVTFLTVMTVLAAAFYNLLGRPNRGLRLRLTPIVAEEIADALAAPASNGNGSAHTNGNGDDHDGDATRPPRFLRFRSLVGRKKAE